MGARGERPDLPPAAPAWDPEPRARLAAEWQAAAPRTAADVAAFYRTARGLGDDLEAWHALPARQDWTRMLVHVARESGAQVVVDIGAGAGHDLKAIKDALGDAVETHGVEPNNRLRFNLPPCVFGHSDVEYAPIDEADLLVCVDVLEHVPHPEDFLAGIATRAKEGCLLFETTATHDLTTPLHLPANAAWHPGRVLERHGWALVDKDGRAHVWQRQREANLPRASLLLCAYRGVTTGTMSSIMATVTGKDGWRLRIKDGDALIARSRAIVVTKWYHETDDDVFLMVDDDIVFAAEDADRLVGLCRAGHDIVCGAYPVRDGGHMAIRTLGDTTITFGPEQPPLEIRYPATGFMAVHRRVIDALVATVPLCHAGTDFAFYPLFQARVAPIASGGHEWLSEDYGFADAARNAGFSVWLDPRTILTHQGLAGFSVRNMEDMHHAIKHG